MSALWRIRPRPSTATQSLRSASDDNTTKPKAGTYLKEAAAGTTLYIGTSNTYATGMTNQGLSIDPNGVVTASGGFVGNVTGNLTGNVTGTISGAIREGC
jgi:hypothetical protein